ncbi:MAG: DUF3575 domain-containing protein [Cyclobacteriaceae bacterium]|nr:DUF3575 domain-containing protein [Cyclobacteriaceae bacterium]
MKLKMYAVLICIAVTVSAGYAQQNVIKINILAPIVKTFNIQYERALTDQSSLQLGFFYTGYSSGDSKFSGFGITPEYRFYLSETAAPQGVYVAPFLRYQSFSIEDDAADAKADFSAFGGGLILGKQWIFKEKVALDIFLGPAYYSGNVDVKSGTEDDFETGAFDGFSLRAGVCFGFRF